MLWDMGLLQEALEAMFALINEMEMAIKINTSIIFGNTAHLMQVKYDRSREGGFCLGKEVDSLAEKYFNNMKVC